jgi:hypothetical protein
MMPEHSASKSFNILIVDDTTANLHVAPIPNLTQATVQ